MSSAEVGARQLARWAGVSLSLVHRLTERGALVGKRIPFCGRGKYVYEMQYAFRVLPLITLYRDLSLKSTLYNASRFNSTGGSHVRDL